MAEQELFDPLDPLGPEYGKINQPILDQKGYSPFEGDKIMMPKINFPEAKTYYPSVPNVGSLNLPNQKIKNNIVNTNLVNPSIPKKPININEIRSANADYLTAMSQSNQDKNNYAKIYSYNSGPDGNAFYKRYAAYGQKKFDEVGFSPLRNNESNFNARTTRLDDFSRMMTHSFIPLFTRGFVSGPKSLGKILRGDFSSGDLEDARVYEEAAAIGQSSKGGIPGFINNTVMNFGYTAGIITEAIAEEVVGALFAAPTVGSSLIATTANNLLKIPKIFKGLGTAKTGYNAVRNTLDLTKSVSAARSFWNSAKSSQFIKNGLRGLNPLENTMFAIKGFKGADNLTDLAILSKTAGGFYRDVRKINMALSEARLEAGMVENHTYDKLYNEAYIANDNRVPSDKELASLEKQSKDAGFETLIQNTALIYGSNSITFNNITSPRGGLRNFIKSTKDDIYEIASREGTKNFGKIGKVVYDKTQKAFLIEKNNLKTLAKGWLKNPIHKSAAKTIGYFKANFTEGIQENLQETIAQANEKYYIDTYQSPTLKTMLYSRAAMDVANDKDSSYFSEAWSEQNPFTAKGFETFASGFFMGTLAGPLNKAVPFLSSTWNRIYDKEGFAKWKTAQTTVAKDLVNKLNKVDMGAFLSSHTENLGVQDLVGQVRNRGSKKEALDAETESFVSQAKILRQTGTFDTFTEKLKTYREYTDAEFADDVNIDLDQVPKYRARIDSSIDRLNKIKDLYDRVDRKNPNPINIRNLDPNDPNAQEKIVLYNAWEKTNENIVFFSEVYDDVLGRRAKIVEKYNKNPNYKNIDNRQKNLLFKPADMTEELDMLNKELKVESELGKNPVRIKELESKIKITKEYFEKYAEFDKFFNRGSYASEIADIIKKETGVEATDEDIVNYMDTSLGSIDNTTISTRIIGELKDSHKQYIKTLAELKGDYVFNNDTEDSFELLIDSYKLSHEKQQMTKYIEVLNDKDAFLDIVRRNADWMRNQNNKKVKYYEDLIVSEMDKVRNNSFLNALADKGFYMSAEDMENYFENGVPPAEIYNNITKEIYPKNSEKYNEIYNEYFKKRETLKEQLNPKKTAILDDAFKQEIDDLISKMKDEISKLPTTEVKVDSGLIVKKSRNETFSIKEAVEQLAKNEYVELTIKDSTDSLVLFKDVDGNIHLNNLEGELFNYTNDKNRYNEGSKYTLQMLPDPLEVSRIEKIYQEKIEERIKSYNEDKENLDLELPFEEVTPEINLDTPDLADFKKDLYEAYQKEYVLNLPIDEQELLANTPDLDQETFEKWYSKPENKKYFDQYNDANRPVISEKEMIFTYRGVDVNTKNLKLAELINRRDDINNQITTIEENIELLGDESELENKKIAEKEKTALETDLKNLNKVIAARQFALFPKSVKESVSRIQKLFKAQDKVEKGQILTEDDEVTGLKKGQKAYKINNLFHRRMTVAMQDVITKKYEYSSQEDVDSVFNQTIAKQGLNVTSINNFIEGLKALANSDESKLKGTNELFFNKLSDELLLLGSVTKQQIDLEIQKNKILDAIQNTTDKTKKDNLYKEVQEIQNKIDGVTTPTTTNTKSDIEKEKSTITDSELKDLKRLVIFFLENPKEPTVSGSVVVRYPALFKAITDIERRRQEALNNIVDSEQYDEGSGVGFFNSFEGNNRFQEVGSQSTIEWEINKFYDAELAALGTDTLTKEKVREILIAEEKNAVKIDTSQSQEEIIANIKQELDKSGLPYKDVISPKFSTYKVILNNGKEVEILKLLKMGEAPIPAYILKGKLINALENEEKIQFAKEKLASLGTDTKSIEELRAEEIAEFRQKILNPDSFIKDGKVDKTLVDKSGNKAAKEIYDRYDKLIKAELDVTKNIIESKDNFDSATKNNTTKDIINSFFLENTFQDGRDAGNFFDLTKDYLETGKKAPFDPKIITAEAYDNLYDYLKEIKDRVDSGEFYLVGRDLVVWDSDILDLDTGRRDRIAGEIDIILANEDGIFVVDIKSGEESKFLNFNNLSNKKVSSKRNDYTIQTSGYATMLEKMIDERVAGIAMLAISRESNKATNQITAAGKPIANGLNNVLEYTRDADGNIIEDENSVKQFVDTKKPFKLDFLVPLNRESVEKEMNQLFPKDKNVLEPGAKRAQNIVFQIFRDKINDITDKNTKANITAIEKIKEAVQAFSSNNNINFPEDILNELEAKSKALRNYTNQDTIENTINKYNKLADTSTKNVKESNDILKNTVFEIDFNNINEDLDDTSDFIQEQLTEDATFKDYFDKDALFKNTSSKAPTESQLDAIKIMKSSRLLSEDEIDDNLNMEEASALIHEGVKRIQFLKVSGATNEKIKEYNNYQRIIFNLMTQTKTNKSNILLSDLFQSTKDDAALGYTKDAVSALDAQIRNIDNQLNNKFTKDKFKDALSKIKNDINIFKQALIDVYELVDTDTGIDIAQEAFVEEGILEVFDQPALNVGDIIYSRENENLKFTITDITDKNISFKDAAGKIKTINISKFDELYITENDIMAGKEINTVYTPTEEEINLTTSSQNTVDDFMTNTDLKKSANEDAFVTTIAKSRENLLNLTKDCK